MLSHLSRLFLFVGTVFAVAAPITIVHWMLLAILPDWQSVGVVAFWSETVAPFYSLTDALLPFDAMTLSYANRQISTLPAFTALLMIGVYLTLLSASNGLLRFDDHCQLVRDQRRAALLKRDQWMKQEKQRQVDEQFQDLLVYVSFPFRQYEQLGQGFYQFQEYRGRELPSLPNTLLIGFDNVEMALMFCIRLQNTMLAYYDTLKRSEARPPFHFVLHCLRAGQSRDDGLSLCAQLARFAGNHQLLLSDELQRLLAARGLDKQYGVSSLGFFSFPAGQNREVFLLKPELPANVYY